MCGLHPANLAFRFVLEIAALAAIGVGAHRLSDGLMAWVLAIVLPLIAAAIWGVFNVPGDRSRSGEAPIAVPGWIRLLIEASVFATAVLLISGVSDSAAVALGIATVTHYLLSIDRVRWLISH